MARIQPNRFPALDGLRGMAVLMVMLHHLGDKLTAGKGLIAWVLYWPQQFGNFGVDLFFVLSGFLITGILTENRTATNYFSAFYWHRTLRIFPLYFLLLAIAMAVLPSLGLTTVKEPIWSYLVFLSNLRLLFPVGAVAYIGVTWTLAIEEQFYVLWSIIVRVSSPKRLATIAGAALAISIIVRNALVSFYHGGIGDVYYFTFAHIDGLAIGALIRIAYDDPRRRKSLEWFAGTAGFLGLYFVVGSWMSMHWQSGVALWTSDFCLRLGLTLIPLLFGALMVQGLLGDGITRRIFDLSWLRRIGAYSYFMYLYHFLLTAPLLAAAHALHFPLVGLPGLILLVAEFAVVIYCARLSFIYFETPLLRWKILVPYQTVEASRDGALSAPTARVI